MNISFHKVASLIFVNSDFTVSKNVSSKPVSSTFKGALENDPM